MTPNNNYKRAICVADGLYRIDHIRYGLQLWAQIKLKKIVGNSGCPKCCAITGKPFSKGMVAYRPMANGYNRMDRISEEGVKILEANR